jgi:hypothetical protein
LPGQYLFIGAVCKEWEAVYAGIADQQVCNICCFCLDEVFKLETCGARTTLYSAAVASPATARLACISGLAVREGSNLQVIAGRYADTETLAALRELGMPLSDNVVRAAAMSGRLNVLQHLLSQQECPKATEISYYAARSGSISMLECLKREGCKFNHHTRAAAAAAGHLAALQYLRSEGCEWYKGHISCCAASSGSIELVEWLQQQQGVIFDSDAMKWAADAGQTAMCKHLRNTGCEWNAEACTRAAESGRSETLRWLREHGCIWDVREVCIRAAGNGHTDILDYVKEQAEVLDAELLTEALDFAAVLDQLQSVQWCRQLGAEWPDVLGYGEHKQWSHDTFAWARAEGCKSPVSQ